MLVSDFLEQSARRWPDKTALVCGSDRCTYADLDTAANRLANYLLAQGVARGDRVVIFMDNCVEAVISIFGILKAGATFVVIHGSTKAQKLAYILNNCGAVALLTGDRQADVAVEALQSTSSIRFTLLVGPLDQAGAARRVVSFQRALASQPTSRPRQRCIDLDLAAIIYTSGSSGFPKGVMAHHLMIVTAATAITEYLENRPDDIILNVLPLSFDYGLYQVLMAFKVGGTLVLEEGFAFPYRVIQLLRAERVTGFPGVPTIFATLLQMRDLASLELPDLRYITNTAAALPVRHLYRLRELFPRAKVYSMYGLTECKRVSYLPPEELDRRPTSVGIAIPNTEVFIVDESGHPVPPGGVGELVVRGSHLMRGYWAAPEESARVLRPGPYPGESVLYTGDLFTWDNEGFLYFVGRKDDIIKTRGEKVSPREVENVLYLLDGVVEAAVIGIPDEILGEAIWAVIATRDDTQPSEREVLAHCARHLESFMVPKKVLIWPSLPKTASGKISRTAIRERLSCAASLVH